MEIHDIQVGDVIKAGLPDEPVIVLDVLKSATTDNLAVITQPLRTITSSRKTYDLNGREKLLKKLQAEEIIQALQADESLKNLTEIFKTLTGIDIEGKIKERYD
jgi:hypothetical protein